MVAIDAPASPSRGFHQADVSLRPKFRTARCAEIALGVGRGYWVPWATTLDGGDFPAWMLVGFSVYETVRRAGFRAIEVYPNSIFREFAGGRCHRRSKRRLAVGAVSSFSGHVGSTQSG